MGLAIVVVAVCAAPARAGAPIQIGQVSPVDPFACIGSNAVQAAVAGPPSYTVPSAGTITSWSHRGKETGPGSGRLQVWRAAGGTNYTLVGRSGIKAFAAGVVNTYATNIPVSAGDLLGFRYTTGTGCGFDGTAGDDNRSDSSATDPTPGQTLSLSISDPTRLNVSATLDPSDAPAPTPPTPTPSATSLDSSATKGKQPAGKLKLKLTADQDSALDVAGKGKVAQRRPAAAAAKAKKYKLKKKTGIALQAAAQKVVRLKFKNNRKSVKRIEKRLKRSKKARKRSKVTVKLTATNAAGLASDSKLKIKLKP